MAATIGDKITNTSNGVRPVSTTVQTVRSSGVLTLACNDLTGWPTDTAVHFVTYKVDGQSKVIAGSQRDWKGIVSGNSIGTLTLTDGSTDPGNAVGDIVEILPTAAYGKDLAAALRTTLNTDGTFKAGAVSTSTTLTDSIVTTTKIADGSVTSAKIAQGGVAGSNIAAGAIALGYTQITSSFTTSLQNATQVTGLSVTVTIPAGGRTVKITAYTGAATNTSNSVSIVTIWDGTVGSGTQIGQGNANGATNSNQSCTAMAIVTPAAGTKTYNVGFQVTGFTSTFGAAAGSPAFILVEAI